MLSCSPGYYLEGQRLMLCKANGTWSGADERPTCKGKKYYLHSSQFHLKIHCLSDASAIYVEDINT